MKAGLLLAAFALAAAACSDANEDPRAEATTTTTASTTSTSSTTSVAVDPDPGPVSYAAPAPSPLDLGPPPDGMEWLDPVAAPAGLSPLVTTRSNLPECAGDGIEDWLRARFEGIRPLPDEAMSAVTLLDVAEQTPVLVAAGDAPACVSARRSGELGGWEMQASDGSVIARGASIDGGFRESDRPLFGGFNFGSDSFGSGESAAGVTLVANLASSLEPRGGEERVFVAETPFAVLTDLAQVVGGRQVGWFSSAQLSPAFHSYGSVLPRHVPIGTVRCLGPVSGPEEWHSERQLLCDESGVVVDIVRLNRRPEQAAGDSYEGVVEWIGEGATRVATVRTPDDVLRYSFVASVDEATAHAMIASVPVLDEAVWRPTPTTTRLADRLEPTWIEQIFVGAGLDEVVTSWRPQETFCQLECVETAPRQVVDMIGRLPGEGEVEASLTLVDPSQPAGFASSMEVRRVGGIEIFGSTDPRVDSDVHARCGDIRIRVRVAQQEGSPGMDRLAPVMDVAAILVDQLGC